MPCLSALKRVISVPPLAAGRSVVALVMTRSSFSLRFVDPGQQPLGLELEGRIGHHLRPEGLRPQAFIGLPPHAFWLVREWREDARTSAEALSHPVCPAQRPVHAPLALAGVSEPVAVPAEEVSAGP